MVDVDWECHAMGGSPAHHHYNGYARFRSGRGKVEFQRLIHKTVRTSAHADVRAVSAQGVVRFRWGAELVAQARWDGAVDVGDA
jgi:hypothetical protein